LFKHSSGGPATKSGRESPQARARRRVGASRLIPTEAHLLGYRAFLEYSGELLSEVIHIIAEFHDRHDAFNLIVNLLASELLQP
jgi:hypothetical protein